MKLVKTKKHRVCKKCNNDIWLNGFYYPQRKDKAICFECGYKRKTIFSKIKAKFIHYVNNIN